MEIGTSWAVLVNLIQKNTITNAIKSRWLSIWANQEIVHSTHTHTHKKSFLIRRLACRLWVAHTGQLYALNIPLCVNIPSLVNRTWVGQSGYFALCLKTDWQNSARGGYFATFKTCTLWKWKGGKRSLFNTLQILFWLTVRDVQQLLYFSRICHPKGSRCFLPGLDCVQLSVNPLAWWSGKKLFHNVVGATAQTFCGLAFVYKEIAHVTFEAQLCRYCLHGRTWDACLLLWH